MEKEYVLMIMGNYRLAVRGVEVWIRSNIVEVECIWKGKIFLVEGKGNIYALSMPLFEKKNQENKYTVLRQS